MHLTVTFGLPNGPSATGFGTGFFVQCGSDGLFLVTARHVVDPDRARKPPGTTFESIRVRGWNFSPNLSAQSQVDLEFKQAPMLPPDEELDIAAFRVDVPTAWNGIVVESFIGVTELASEGEFDTDIRTGDFLAAPGFSEMDAVDNERPLLLTGIVSSDPRAPVKVRPSGFTARSVMYQSLSRAGLSGAPVFATQRGLHLGGGLSGPRHRPMRLIGVNAGSFVGHDRMPLQFSYFTRSSDVLELLGR